MKLSTNLLRHQVNKVFLISIALSGFTLPGNTFAGYTFYGGRVPIHFEDLHTSVRLTASYTERWSEFVDRRKTSTGFGQSLQLQLQSGGYLYHPALLSFGLSFSPSFNKTTVSLSNANNQEIGSTFLSYGINTRWLSKKPYAFTINASNSRSESSNRLQANTINEIKSVNAATSIPFRDNPLELSFSKTETNSYGYFNRNQEVESIFAKSDKKHGNGETRFRARFQRRGSKVSDYGQIENTSFYGTINNTARLGERLGLSSFLNFRQFSTGATDANRVYAGSDLSAELPGNLFGTLNISASDSPGGDNDARSISKAFRATHQLYENLRTSIGIGEVDAPTIERRSRSASIGYNRRLPKNSRINLGFTRSQNTTSRTEQESIERHFDEPYTFEGISTVIVLEDTGIDPSSIVVTSADGSVFFQEGFDYSIEESGGSVLIIRNELGEIKDEETVLINYDVLIKFGGKTMSSATGHYGSLQLTNLLSVAFSNSRGVNDQVYDGSSQLTENESWRVSLRTKLGSTKLSLRRQTLPGANYEAKSVDHQANYSLTSDINIQSSLGYSHSKSLLTGETVEGLSISAGSSFRVKRSGFLALRAGYHRYRSFMSDGVSRDTRNNWGISSNYRWKLGAWDLVLSASASHAENTFLRLESDNTDGGVSVGFSGQRRFR